MDQEEAWELLEELNERSYQYTKSHEEAAAEKH